MVQRADEVQAPRKDSKMGLAELSTNYLQRDRKARLALGVSIVESCSELLCRARSSLASQLPLNELQRKSHEFQRTIDSADWAALRVLFQRQEAYSKAFELRDSFADSDPQKRTTFLELGFGSEFYRALSALGHSFCPQHPIPALLCYQILELDRQPPFFGEEPFRSPVRPQALKRATAELSWATRRPFPLKELLHAKTVSDHVFETLLYERKGTQEYPRTPGSAGVVELFLSLLRRPAS